MLYCLSILRLIPLFKRLVFSLYIVLCVSGCLESTFDVNKRIEEIYSSHYPAVISSSPDGTKLLLKDYNAPMFSLDIYDVNSKKLTSINKDKNGQVAPQWSRDGRELAFLLNPNGRQDYKMHIFNLRSGEVQLLQSPKITNPKWSWSPNGQFMAFLNEHRRLMVFDRAKPSNVVFETDLELSDRAPFVWDETGSILAYVLKSADNEILLRDFKTGKISNINTVGTILNFCWQKDSPYMVANIIKDKEYKIYQIGFKFNREIPIHLSGEAGPLYSTFAGDRIIFTEKQGFTDEVKVINLQNGNFRSFPGRVFSIGQMDETAQIYEYNKNVVKIKSINLLTLNSRILYRQIKGKIKDTGVEKLLIKSNERNVPALLWKNDPKSRSILILIHGGPYLHYDSEWNAELEALLDFKVDVLLLNYSGSSGFGEEHRNGIIYAVEDIKASVDHLKASKGYANVFLKGDSFGSKLTLEYLQDNSHVVEGAIITSYIKSAQKIKQAKFNMLVFQGENDHVCSPSCAKLELQHQVKNYKDRILVMNSEGHSFRRVKSWARVLEKSLEFIKSHEVR